jgi:hypothetical protein
MIYKKNLSRVTKLAAGRELTKGNSFSARLFEDRNPMNCSAANLTSAEHAWIGNLGRPFLTSEIFTLNHSEKSILEKCLISPFLALNRETRLDQFQLAGSLWKKGGRNSFLATREYSLWSEYTLLA